MSDKKETTFEDLTKVCKWFYECIASQKRIIALLVQKGTFPLAVADELQLAERSANENFGRLNVMLANAGVDLKAIQDPAVTHRDNDDRETPPKEDTKEVPKREQKPGVIYFDFAMTKELAHVTDRAKWFTTLPLLLTAVGDGFKKEGMIQPSYRVTDTPLVKTTDEYFDTFVNSLAREMNSFAEEFGFVVHVTLTSDYEPSGPEGLWSETYPQREKK